MEQIYIGNFPKGLTSNRLPFNIDNDAFPYMVNFYTWRGRAKRKRGTKTIGQLERQISSANPVVNPWEFGGITFSNDYANLFSFLGLSPSAVNITNITQATQAVVTVPGSAGLYFANDVIQIAGVTGMTEINDGFYTIVSTNVDDITIDVDSSGFTPYAANGIIGLVGEYTISPNTLSILAGANTYTEPATPDGTLVGAPAGTGTIYYTSGIISISGFAAGTATGTFNYYPGLPVMGLKDFSSSISSQLYPLLIAFDTEKSYQVNQSTNAIFYDVTYYKYSEVPFVWSGEDYQQFWTTNYPSTTSNLSGSLWATNNKPGFHFVDAQVTAGSGTNVLSVTLTSNGSPFQDLVAGVSTTADQLWFNEFGSSVDGQVGYVSAIVNAALGQYQVTFSGVVVAVGTHIAQLLTNSISGEDGIKWYDGDPTGGTGIPAASSFGWVNFAPPLTASTSVSIAGAIAAQYYLVGALAIVPYKDRLLFLSPYIQAPGAAAIQLQDTILWSWVGTPYYNSIVPTNAVYDVRAYYVDQTGLGGYLPAGISNPIKTVGNNEDVLIVGFGGDGRKTRFVYTGDDLQPFLFFNINTELPSQSTFSAISLDAGTIDIGQYGIAMTDQQTSQRIDLQIPDEVFEIQEQNNGVDRVSGIRDFFREWIYFCYPVDDSDWRFPTQTFLFNYRDNTWAILYENFTTYGRFRRTGSRTWQNTGFASWSVWNEPWNSGAGSKLFANIAAGTPQGFVLELDQGTGEAPSGNIVAIQNANDGTKITSFDHCVSGSNPLLGVGDYIYITGCIGATDLNGQIGQVSVIDISANTFIVDIDFPDQTYLGGGQFTRLSQPLIQTKQFPLYWNEGRQIRIGPQRYLMETTSTGQVTVNIYTSQDPDDAWNNPAINPPPNGLIYSQILYTCPESTNLGLTPPNVNLQMPTAVGQFQTWHRLNTSLLGDTFQVGITLSDDQMRNLSYATDEIALHGMQFQVSRGPMLA